MIIYQRDCRFYGSALEKTRNGIYIYMLYNTHILIQRTQYM